jgi:DGQHR domain-containing protein
MQEALRSIEFPALEIRQPIGAFYVAVIRARDLLEIAHFDVRRIQRVPGDESLDDYLGIQREVSPTRIRELNDYVNTVDATFPTAVILAVDERCVELTPINPKSDSEIAKTAFFMKLRNVPGDLDGSDTILFREIARVIDGQHRIVGLQKRLPTEPEFEINVAIFVGIDVADQAGIFSTVNLAQTKVNRSLAYDLFEYSKTRSPEKSAHQIALLLDQRAGSPFFHKIKRLGTRTDGRFGETLSQATVVQSILAYTTENFIRDRDIGKRTGKWPAVGAAEAFRFIFRRWFVGDEDEKTARLMWNYFQAVSNRWPEAWRANSPGVILNRTNGYMALMRFLRPAYLSCVKEPGELVGTDQFEAILNRVELRDEDFNRTAFLPGSTGQKTLYELLMEQTGLAGP